MTPKNNQRRRYLPIASFPDYNNDFDRYMADPMSPLNVGDITIPSSSSILWDKQNLETQLMIRKGDQEGLCYKEHRHQPALIPLTEKKLQDLEEDFQSYCHQRTNLGYPMPKVMPPEIQRKKYQLEARLDAYLLECEVIEKKLAELSTQTVVEDLSHILEHGPKCTGWLSGGVLSVLDGQKVSMNADGVLFINSPSSKYFLMAVTDYREMSSRWLADRRQVDAEKLRKIQEQAKQLGQEIPKSLPFRSGHKISPASLPSWPAGVERVNPAGNPKAETVEVEGIQRKKKTVKTLV